jgi:hypothetical protein
VSDLSTMTDAELLALKARLGGGPASPPQDLSAMSDEQLIQLRTKLQGGPATTPARPPNPGMLDILGAAIEGEGTMTPQGAKAMARGTAKGLGDIGRGFGVLDQMTPEQRAEFDAFAKQNPEATVGEILGQVAPFLVPAGLAANIASLPVRAAAMSGIGAVEGYTVTRGQGGTKTQSAIAGGIGAGVGVGSEVLLPVIGRVAGTVARELGIGSGIALLTPDGFPTDLFQKALDKAGISFADIQNTALTEIKKLKDLTDPDQAARLARFRSEGIEPTTGQVTQDFGQQSREARLTSMATGPDGEPLRQRFLEQSQQFENSVTDLVGKLGVPGDAGEKIKAALMGREKLLRQEKNALYKKVSEASPQLSNAPILTDSIIAAIPQAATQRRVKRLAGTQGAALDDLLVEFGLNQKKSAVDAYIKANPEAEITPLTLGNFEDFRQALNLIERTDQTGAISNLTKPIKEALDEEAALIDDAVKRSGLSDEGVLDTLREARKRVRELKTDFSPQSIVGRLVDVKRDGVTPVIEASQVASNLLAPGTPIENLQRVVTNLSKSGDRGAQAMKDLQGAAIMQALDNALKAPSRKTTGVQTISGNQFAKTLDTLGEDKLAVLFQGNEGALNRLRNLRQIALDLEPASAATPKGSAPIILDALARVGRLPVVAPAVDVVNFIIRAGADDRAVNKALRGRPELMKQARLIADNYPSLASVIGLPVILNRDEEDAPQR